MIGNSLLVSVVLWALFQSLPDETLKLQGVYEIKTLVRTGTETRAVDQDRLVISRTIDNELKAGFALSDSYDPLNYVSISKVDFSDGVYSFTGEGKSYTGLHSEMRFQIQADTGEINGVLTDSRTEGYKEFSGKAIWRLQDIKMDDTIECSEGVFEGEWPAIRPALTTVQKVSPPPLLCGNIQVELGAHSCKFCCRKRETKRVLTHQSSSTSCHPIRIPFPS